MKKFFTGLTGLALVLSTLTTSAQVHRCATTEYEAELLRSNPKREKQLAQFEQLQQAAIANFAANKNQSSIVTIPVVVHVLYANAAQNISVAQIMSQLEVLNEDFAKLNADTVNTPAVFKPVAAATQLQFCLAQQDPNGLPTTGIERRSTTVSGWSTNNAIKSFASGGLNAWDPTRYFNIWVGKLSNFVLGYGEFPTSSVSNTWGVVIDYQAFGTTGAAQAPFNLGRTATHEVGHCFNLRHIWGDDGGSCSGTDFCADTPNQGGENYNCPSYPLTDNCATTNPGVMFMNYMDYVNDNCMNMFTNNQATRVNAVINTVPYNALQTSNGCMPPVTATDDAGVASITSPGSTVCSSSFIPAFNLFNYGSSTLTSVTVTYNVDGGTPLTYNWTGNLSAGNSVSVSLPSITVAASGNHTFTVTTSQPNGQTDGDPSNDSQTVNFTISGGGSAQGLPYSEGFEGAFPAAGMTLVNPDADITWEQTSLAAKTGLQSVYMDNYDYLDTTQTDDIILPAVDLTSGQTANTIPYLSFQLAYQLYTNPALNQYSDTLEVLVSTDCGNTYTSVYKKFGAALTTVIPNYSTTEFIPGTSNWRKDSISLAPYMSSNNVIVKFHHMTDYENNLYLDDINIYQWSTTGLNAVEGPLVSVFPNPVKEVLNIRSRTAVRIELFDAKGQKVYDSVDALRQEVIRIETADFAKGVYMLKATSATDNFTTRFVKQ